MDRRIIKTKEAIKIAYIELLLENHNSKITITKLANHANIDRKTFYLHYSSVDDVLLEIMENKLIELDNEINKYESLKTTIDVYAIMQALNTIIMKDFYFCQALSKRSDFDFFTNKVKEFLLKASVFALSSSGIPQPELTLYCKFFISGIVDLYSDWFSNPMNMTLEDLGNQISRIMNEGIMILSKKG